MFIATIIFLVLSGLCFMISKQPAEFRISRSEVMSVPAAKIFPYVNDLHKWQEWSPWAKMDPNAKEIFEGPASGSGASFSWDGNNKVGQGRMTIIDSRADELVRFRLEFMRPFKATNIAEFTFTFEDNKTRLTWTMSGTNNFVGKAMSLIMNCDKMVGGQFGQGLSTLKSIVER
jgi:hypothetical protein